MGPSALIRIFFLLLYFENISSAIIFRVDEKHPSSKKEIDVCGNIRDVIKRNSARFLKILVRNTNSEISFQNDDARRMTARAKSKLDVLASRVQGRWSGRKVRVLKSWTDVVVHGSISLHYEGRALQLRVDDNDNKKLGELAGLAVESGFDFVHYTKSNYVHASVIRDVCQTSVDLAFILDTSGSVGSNNFDKIKIFVKNVIDFFNVGSKGTHVAVVTYSTSSQVEFYLNTHTTKTSLKKAVNQIYYRAGWTYTADAIEMTKDQIFTKKYGMRPDKGIPKIAVLLTDGYSSDYHADVKASDLKKQGVSMFCIGVGRNTNKKELRDIASDPDSDHVFSMENFNDLSVWVDKLSAVSCDEGAAISACDDTISKVDGGSFLYFKTEFKSNSGGISVEVRDIKGISHMYTSLKSKNPGPMDPNSWKNEKDTSPRSLRITFPSQNSKQLVFVAVQGQKDVNEFKISMWDTLFSSDSYTANKAEENTSPVAVIRVSSTLTQYRLRYSITHSSNQARMFRINPTSGQITTNGRLDREKTARYDLTVLAQDIDRACHKGRTVVTVNVKDINDNKPFFEKLKYYADVKENSPSGSSVAIVTATDKDSTSVLTYSLINNFNAFSIDNNGIVQTTTTLDYERQKLYTLQIKANDGKFEAKTILEISVVDVNERPVFRAPCVTSNKCVFPIREDAAVNNIITTLDATDPDGGKIKYALRFLDSQDKVFSIDSSGKIALLKKLDRETKSVYNMLVTASDDGKPVLAAQVHVKVDVTDVNDNAPKFPRSSYTGSVYENTHIGREVIQVVAVDADIGTNSKLTYSLQGGNAAYFYIEPTTGIIRTKISLDRENRASYQLTVRAVDGGGLDGQTSVRVNVLDTNDNVPRFTKNRYDLSVREDVMLGNGIGMVSAMDNDIGINQDLRYSIVTGNHGNSFYLDPKTGQVKVLASLDYERRKSYTMRISVSDRGSPALSSTSTLVVTVTDVNDNSPIFGAASYHATVKENSAKGTSVLKVLATDRDSELNRQVQYFVTSGNDYNTFAVDANSGLITINTPPSFKTKSQYDLTIEARDKGAPMRKASVHAVITIEDVNDNEPKFDSNQYNAQVREDANKGTVVMTVTASDADTGPRGRVLYSIVSGNVGNKFTIDGSKGAIRVSSNLDRETTPAFLITIEARDGGNPPLSSKCVVNVTIVDINDNAPTFNGPYTFHVSEDKSVGTLVGQVTATDRDAGNNGKVTYSGTTGIFNVDGNTGKITLAKTVDHESQALYSLTVTAMDHGSPSKQTTTVVKVIVDDVNDNPPKFLKDMYNCSVAENMARGAAVCYVTAVDPDSGANGRLFYSLTGGNNKFTINSATGELTTTAPLDREATGSYHLRVTAKDGQRTSFRSAASFSDTVDVYVTIQDENDNQPEFVGAPFKFDVGELAAVGTVVGRVSAVDADAGINGKLTFTILNGNTGSAFTINSANGVISVSNKLDRETIASYSLTVQAQDSGKPVPQTSRTVVMVTINDVNDNPPAFDQNMFYGAIREDASIGSSVLQVKAHDSDSGSNGQINYSLSGPGCNNFTIDATGFIKSATALDYEQTSGYIMTVTARDSGKPSLSATAHVNITIVNVNDNVPSFDSHAQITDVSEDVAIGTRVVKLNATDSDGSSLTFDIIDGNEDGSFAIGRSSGVISVAKRLDRETTPNYTLVVQAKDQDGKAVSNNATIRVLDVNDNKPLFDKSSYSATITENNAKGVTLVKVQATDRDEGSNAKITYLLTSGDKNKFQVHPSTGVITIRVTLDREQQSSYVLSVTAKDHGRPSQSSVVKVTVTVDDVNDNTPTFPQSAYAILVVENTALNSVVLRLHASDPDWGNNGQVSYTIVSGNTNNTFTINAKTGQLSVTGSIDRETTSGYNLVVRASDTGSPQPRSSTASVKISVTDENDNAPKYTNKDTTFVVKENAARGTQVGVVVTTDADVGENARIKFEIMRDADGAFLINPTSGVITVNGKIDRETKATYLLTIRASDNGSTVMFTDKSFNVVVEDVNDNSPVFDQKLYRGSVSESAPIGSIVETVKATDADTGANAVVRYQIFSGNSQGVFAIDPVSGKITTKSTLDYETKPSYVLKVSATDTKYTSYADIAVDVVNINDNSPVFTKRSYTGSVQENAAVLTKILSVSANDVDPFDGLVYSINTNYPYSDKFNIDPTSGAITTAEALDRETKDTYVIQVLVKDNGVRPILSDAAMVTITVTDVNDNPPTFTGSSFWVSVLENATVGTSVFKLDAKDLDKGNNAKITYSLVQSSEFRVEADTGIVRTAAKLDRETTPSYTLLGTATDHGNPRRTSKRVVIHVTVLDVNDNAPRFEKDQYNANVNEDEAVGGLVKEVVAVDLDLDDAGKVVYSITGGNHGDMFNMNNVAGIISLGKALDREIKDTYQLTVKATDLGTPPMSSTTQVNIKILDVNDNTPQFNTSSLRGSVKENEPAGTYVMRLTATDKDLNLNGQLTFELLTPEYKNVFSLNDSTGVITTKKKLDRETQVSYTLKARVSDMGTPPLSSPADVIIDVIDVDDNCPFFQPSEYNVTIRENEKRGTRIVFVSATDPDKVANDIMDYKIKSGMPGGEFRINRTTGEITVDNNVDREGTAVFKLTVRAGQAKCDESDKNDTGIEGGSTDVLSTASAIVNIYVEDVNDNAPRFTKPSYEYDFNDIATTELFTIGATDDDLGLDGMVEYELAGQTDVNGDRHVTVSAKDRGSPSLKSDVTVVVKTRLACEAMVFDVTEGGKISTKTLCTFDETPGTSTINSGLLHEFKCSAKGNTKPEYRWMLNGRFITSWSPDGIYSIKRLSQEDEGRYSCLARSDAGVIQSSPATLTVYDVPVIIAHPENSSVSLDGTTILECQAKGDPPPSYQWYKNGEVLPPIDGIDPKKPKLVLEKAIPQDEALYSCRVTNAAGKVTSKSAFLKVYAPKVLVNLEISVSKPHPDKRCHVFDIKSFKALLSKVVEADATFTNVSSEGICKPDPCGNCKNGGVCKKFKQENESYLCVCAPGWTGDQCGINVNECLRAPCIHGTCQNKIGTYECTCSKNFTGKDCNLREDACHGTPCNKSELCVRYDKASKGYQCVDESKEMVMEHKEVIDKSRSFDLEKEIEGLIKSAPNNNDVNTKRRRRNTPKPDYGSCTVRITSFVGRIVHFVLLCPSPLSVDPKETTRFVCGLLFKDRKCKSCGIGSALMTPVPPTTYAPMPPMKIKILLFARDRESNKDIESNAMVSMLKSEGFQREMMKQGIEIVTAKSAIDENNSSKSKVVKKANVGLIVGIVALVIIVVAGVGVVVGYFLYQRRKGKQTLIPVEDRGMATRGGSRNSMLEFNASNKDITRSEKTFFNQAYDSSMYEDGGEEFMVEVNLSSTKKTQPKSLAALHEAPYYYDKIAPIEAEMLLDPNVPVGTFLVRKGIQPDEYVLTIKCPEGGPSHRHLVVTHTNKDQLEVQFGSMPLSLEFDSICDVIEHFQVTPIEFGGDDPDVALASGWSKTLV